jgi:hypothetical protein
LPDLWSPMTNDCVDNVRMVQHLTMRRFYTREFNKRLRTTIQSVGKVGGMKWIQGQVLGGIVYQFGLTLDGVQHGSIV